MNPNHHPSEPVLAAYAAGSLADGPSLVVSAHLERCPRCRAELDLYEAVGGALIAEAEPVAMSQDALALALARIERPPEPPSPPPAPPRLGPDGLTLPRALARRGVGPRRFVGPGIWVAPIASKRPEGWRTYLLRAPSGIRVPHHGHNGDEFTIILQGSFIDETGRYGPGDFAEVGIDAEHHPEAQGPQACICLISGEGGIKAGGLLKWAQPFLGV